MFNAFFRLSHRTMRFRIFLLSLLLCLLYVLTGQAQPVHYAETCASNVDNASVLIPSTVDPELPNGARLESADTLAVRDESGNCVGYGVWDGDALVVAAAGPTSVAEATSGYENGAKLSYEVFDATAGNIVDLGSQVTYASCSNVAVGTCRDDGLYADGGLFVINAFMNSALPVQFTSLEAKRQGRRVVLEWTTTQETNNAGFEVQHRPPNTNATNWKTLRFVDGAGTTSDATTYDFTTERLDVGDHEFRLQQVDQDGNTALSKNVGVEVTLEKAYELSPVAPNPLRQQGTFSIIVQEAQTVTVEMYNVLGQRIATLYDRQLSANREKEIRVSVQNQSSGVYFLRVKGETFRDTRKMTVVQ